MRSLCPNSYWHETATAGAAQFASLGRDARADVAVIGAGITGLTAALHLKRAGRRVVVLEAGRIGDGTTGGTTAHLDALPDQGMRQFIKDFGEDAARTVTQGRLAAIDHLEAWCRDFGIACDFARIPAYAYTEEPDHVASLEAECDACRKMGMQVGMTTDIPLPFACAGGFRIERQGRFHALDYLRGLAAQVEGEGCTIHEMTRAFPPESGTPCTIPTEHGQVKAEQVLAATHSAFFGISQLDMRVAPYQSYVMAARVQQSIPDALYWDDAEPYRYTRRARSDDPNLLIVGGADHKTGHGDPQEHYGLLEEYIRRRYTVQAIEQRWSAEYFEPSDGQPYVGAMALAPHLYAATGFSGTGMTYGTMAGQLIADLILGRTNSLASIWSPTRIKPLASAHDFLAENFDIAKRFIGDRLRRERIPSLEAIGPGEGRLVAIDGKQVAVYRDRQGLVHAMSPTCTHAGCVVQWNNAERTWDCPCHGGRYSATGERIYGPPSQDLHRTQVE